MTDPEGLSLRAEALSPELITLEGGHQILRIALRTETGTIVYADLGAGEASAYAGRLGRLGDTARRNAEGASAKGAWPDGDPVATHLVNAVRRQPGGRWFASRLEQVAEKAGIRMSMDEAGAMLWTMVKAGVMRSDGRFFEVV